MILYDKIGLRLLRRLRPPRNDEDIDYENF